MAEKEELHPDLLCECGEPDCPGSLALHVLKWVQTVDADPAAMMEGMLFFLVTAHQAAGNDLATVMQRLLHRWKQAEDMRRGAEDPIAVAAGHLMQTIIANGGMDAPGAMSISLGEDGVLKVDRLAGLAMPGAGEGGDA